MRGFVRNLLVTISEFVARWRHVRLFEQECIRDHACCVEGPCNGLPRPPDVRPPHCDSGVLHAVGACSYCDLPECAPLHAYRDAHGINHTGERDPKKKTCPAEAARSIDIIHRWHGNRPSKESP